MKTIDEATLFPSALHARDEIDRANKRDAVPEGCELRVMPSTKLTGFVVAVVEAGKAVGYL